MYHLYIACIDGGVLLDKFTSNNLHKQMQSAYRQNHSTETGLLKVHSDILSAVDNGCVVVLVLLDLTAAFDTIDHGILLSRLRHRFGVTGAALDWLRSYLAGNSLFVSRATTRPLRQCRLEYRRDPFLAHCCLPHILHHSETSSENTV